MEQQHFEVVLRRGYSGRPETQKRTLRGLGLRRIGQTVYLKDTPAIRGMLYKVVHLIDVAPKPGAPAPGTRARARTAVN